MEIQLEITKLEAENTSPEYHTTVLFKAGFF